MDASRFDDLSRALAYGASRRRVLGGLAGGLAAAWGLRREAAAVCRGPGRLCVQNANCCSGLCDASNPDPTKRNRCTCPSGTVACGDQCVPAGGCCINGTSVAAGATNPANQCQSCQPQVDGNRYTTRPNGTACNDNNACTTGDVCTNGVCAGTPVTCGQCQTCVGGQCVPNQSANGTACNDGNACTQNDVCTNGTCAGTPITCGPCSICSAGQCVANAAANGTACNDNNACTIGDVCQNGTCAGTPITCPQCQICVGGQCTPDAAANGTSCNDENACTTGDVCTNGTCAGTLVTCPRCQICSAGLCVPDPNLNDSECDDVTICSGVSCLPGENVCLANGTCAETCVCGATCEPTCPEGCLCSTDSLEGPQYCVPGGGTCDTLTQPCNSTAECPQGRACLFVGCGPSGISVGRCVPVCTSTPSCANLTCAGNCCLPGQDACLANGSCAETCVCGETCESTCPTGCFCSTDSLEGPQYCVSGGGTCDTLTQPCNSTGECDQGSACLFVGCGPGGVSVGRCVPLCTAT